MELLSAKSFTVIIELVKRAADDKSIYDKFAWLLYLLTVTSNHAWLRLCLHSVKNVLQKKDRNNFQHEDETLDGTFKSPKGLALYISAGM